MSSKWAIWPNLYPKGKKTERQKDEKTTSRDLLMRHLTNFIPPRKKNKKTKDVNSRPPNEPSYQIYTARTQDLQMSDLTKFIPPQKKKRQVEKISSQYLQKSHLTKFIPPRKKKKRKKKRKKQLKTSEWAIWPNLYHPRKKAKRRRKNNNSRPPNEPSD